MPGIKTYFARVAKTTSTPRREESIHSDYYSTPTTTRTVRTPVTAGSKQRNYSTPKTTRNIQTPATSGRTRHYTKPTLIYRPLELDTESSSESSDDILRHRSGSARAIEGVPLCLPAPNNGSPQKQLPRISSTPSSKPLQVLSNPIQKNQDAVSTPKRKQPNLDEDDDDDIQIIQVVIKPNESVKTPNAAKRRKSYHQTHEQSHRKSATVTSPSEEYAIQVTEKKPIEIVQASQCMTPPITPEKAIKEVIDGVEKEMVPDVKLPAFIPGNCNIEELMRYCGVKRGSDPDLNTPKKSEAL